MPAINKGEQGLFIPFPIVRILFYADSSQSNLMPVPFGEPLRDTPFEFGLTIIKNVLEASVFHGISVTVINRFWDYNPDGSISNDAVRKDPPEKVTGALLQNYDEIWFFGKHLGSFTPGDLPGFGMDMNGYPDSALDDTEVSALRDWMDKGGGVLILGDHSNHPSKYRSGNQSNGGLVYDPSQGGIVDETPEFYNLGRALGQNVPRAGQMRVWQGGPGGYAPGDPGFSPQDAIVNTSGDSDDMVSMPKQENGIPQTIFPLSWRTQGNRRQYHQLFVGSPRDDDPSGIITVFPDHGHEGAVTMPPNFDPALWPSTTIRPAFQPKPVVVAQGINHDTQTLVGLVSAYDGHQAGVGRIVAHSTWHHFVNVNLHAFRSADPSTLQPETFQIIIDYFLNLVWYLMPLNLRMSLTIEVVRRLATSSNMHDLAGSRISVIGRAAYQRLVEVATGGQILDIINLAVEQAIPPTKDNATLQLPIPNVDYLLGGLITEQQNGEKWNHEKPDEFLGRGIKRALHARVEELTKEAKAITALL